jgi:hypothetical protein
MVDFGTSAEGAAEARNTETDVVRVKMVRRCRNQVANLNRLRGKGGLQDVKAQRIGQERERRWSARRLCSEVQWEKGCKGKQRVCDGQKKSPTRRAGAVKWVYAPMSVVLVIYMPNMIKASIPLSMLISYASRFEMRCALSSSGAMDSESETDNGRLERMAN